MIAIDIPHQQVIQAIVEIESNGDLYAIGDDGKSFGVMQIRQECLDDVNKANGTSYTTADLLGERGLSEWVFMEYMKLYATDRRLGRTPTGVDLARIWQGGPMGHKKISTIPYARKFIKLAYENQ